MCAWTIWLGVHLGFVYCRGIQLPPDALEVPGINFQRGWLKCHTSRRGGTMTEYLRLWQIYFKIVGSECGGNACPPQAELHGVV
ncbi:hypothetical protein CCHR01_13681 [Colletotrichum chrysophilum]|uniref:Secreted protein n=1 Tax=Colletotrichum chrysophilum TaxID=1836956 RepID=A0AAD9A906_9PEZI|nr:hypothetical protein K456DRAFT_55600 [Colletotrichum gloeosporioides 23]KAK1843681.1 hypothetical protein CCHR01_13681 [Colletotrichum chrysophilum]